MDSTELHAKCALYKAIIISILQDRGEADYTITGERLQVTDEDLILSGNDALDAVTVTIAPNEYRRVIS